MKLERISKEHLDEFIKMVDESLFCSRSKSKSRTWSLTWLPKMMSPPTNDWEVKKN